MTNRIETKAKILIKPPYEMGEFMCWVLHAVAKFTSFSTKLHSSM